MKSKPASTRRTKKSGESATNPVVEVTWIEDLKAARLNKGLSFQAAAELVGVTRGFWFQVEKGMCKPSPALAVLMLNAVGIRPDKTFKILKDMLDNNPLRGASGNAQVLELTVAAALAGAGFQIEMHPKVEGKSYDIGIDLPGGISGLIEVTLKS